MSSLLSQEDMDVLLVEAVEPDVPTISQAEIDMYMGRKRRDGNRTERQKDIDEKMGMIDLWVSKKRKSEPVIEFKDIDEAVEYLKYWQKVLFLDDWIIKVEFMEDTRAVDYLSDNDIDYKGKSAVIILKRFDEKDEDRIRKPCHEGLLVYELLHCKYDHVFTERIYEDKTLHILAEQTLGQMAKTLMMVKYGIGFEWFRNF